MDEMPAIDWSLPLGILSIMSRRINYDRIRGVRTKSYSKIVGFFSSHTCHLWLSIQASSSRSSDRRRRPSEARDS